MTDETPGSNSNLTNISPREIVLRYIRYLPWVIISVAIFLILSYLKIRYSNPVYNVTAKLLVKSQLPYGGSGGDKFDDIFMMQSSSRNLNDEMEIIKSRPMAERVVKSLGAQLQILNKGSIRTSLIYTKDAPFVVHFIGTPDSSVTFSLPVTITDDNDFTIDDNPNVHHFGEIIKTKAGDMQLLHNGNNLRNFSSGEFILSWKALNNRASDLSGALNITQGNDFSNVLTLSFQTENTKTGIDIVNQYMEEYQESSLEDKRQIAVNTLDFIDEQLDTVRKDLSGAEHNLQQYREKNQVFAPDQQNQLMFGVVSQTTQQLSEQEVKLKVIEYLIKYISDSRNIHKMVPSTLGIEEPSLVEQISEFNQLQLQRETDLKSVPAQNPLILNIETAIEKLRTDMLSNLANTKQAYDLAVQKLENIDQEVRGQIRTIPRKEKQMVEVTRQQSILQDLYSYLLQKKLETAISSASTISNIQVVEPAIASSIPVSPNRKALYMIALVLGVAAPAGIVLLMEYLNDKVKTKADVEKQTSTPILGEVGHAEKVGTLVVTNNNRLFIAEQFRIIRSNLQYILPKVDKPVIMVTSSVSGEGKSFVSTNLGAVLAISGKRTVVLEFDIRKPKIMKGLGLKERRGITNYIVGSAELDELIYPVPGVENLFVIPCGPVPPNPAEMLLEPRVKELFVKLRERFDNIIVDTAPVFLVSDSITLGQHADAVVFIVRHNYTIKRQLSLVEDLYMQQKLPHLSIIINDIQSKSRYGSYYGYGGYGYGYGYGYGQESGYFEDGRKKKKWRSIFRSRS